jgi:hypothetical protein
MIWRLVNKSVATRAWFALRQPPFKQRMRMNEHASNWLFAVCDRVQRAQRDLLPRYVGAGMLAQKFRLAINILLSVSPTVLQTRKKPFNVLL